MQEELMVKESIFLNVNPEKYLILQKKKDFTNLMRIYMEAVLRKISDNYSIDIEFAEDIKYLIEDYIENFYNNQEN